MNDYDVIVVGAGPSGIMCAKKLLENGLKVIIIERKKIPRYKCCCGLLSEHTVELINQHFGEIPENIICDERKISLRVTKTGNFIDVPDSELINANRFLFDKWLFENTNPEFLDQCSYNLHESMNDGLKVTVTHKGERKSLTCNYLIGADGGFSSVRRSMDLEYKTINHIYAYQVIYKAKSFDMDKKYIYYFTGKKFSSEFAWIYSENDILHIGTSFYKALDNPPYFSIFLEYLKDRFKIEGLSLIKREGCFVDVRKQPEQFNFGKDKILLIGEACGLLSEFGGGIEPALESGLLAAKSILSSENSIKNYIDSVEKIKEEVKASWLYFNYDRIFK